MRRRLTPQQILPLKGDKPQPQTTTTADHPEPSTATRLKAITTRLNNAQPGQPTATTNTRQPTADHHTPRQT